MASILKRPDRPLPYFVTWREPVTKAQRSKAFKRLKDAEAFRDTVSTEIRNGAYTDRRPVPFSTFAADWLTRTRPAVSPNTGALYEWAIQKYLVPGFGLTAIQNLTAEAIERWQAELLTAGKPGPRSVEICRTVLGTMLKDARRKGRLYVNPMEAVRRFDVPKRELHYLTAAQVKALCEQVGRMYGVLFLVMAFCGLRIGEVLGLEWPDLDLTRRRLFVQRQALWRRKRDCQEGKPRWHLAEPKSKAGTRVVEIPAPLVAFLVAHREAQNGGPNPLGLVFPSEDGTPLYPGNVRRRVFKPALTALGLTGIRPHDFRRTFVAFHVEAGTHPKLVQERAGHSDIKTTMNLYGALAGKMALGEEQAARLDSMATATAETLVNTWSTGATKTPQNNQSQPEARKAISA
jgi:integrase